MLARRVACFLALLLIAPAWGKAPAPAPNLKNSGHPVIDVLFAYTPAARTAYGRRIEELMYAAVVQINKIFRDRHVDAEFRLVRSVPVTYDEAGRTYQAMLADLQKMEAGKRDSDGYY